jgi:hypothetical protein
MKVLLILLFVFEYMGSFAQQNKLSYGINYSLDYNNVVDDDGRVSKIPNPTYKSGTGYTFGINLKSVINTNSSFETGIQLISYNGERSYIDSYGYSRYQHSYQFISIPFNYLRYLNQGDLRFFSTIGICLAYKNIKKYDYTLVSSRGFTSTTDLSDVNESPADKTFIGVMFAVGISYTFKDNYEIRFSPYTSLMSRPRGLVDAYNVLPYIIGVNTAFLLKPFHIRSIRQTYMHP